MPRPIGKQGRPCLRSRNGRYSIDTYMLPHFGGSGPGYSHLGLVGMVCKGESDPIRPFFSCIDTSESKADHVYGVYIIDMAWIHISDLTSGGPAPIYSPLGLVGMVSKGESDPQHPLFHA